MNSGSMIPVGTSYPSPTATPTPSSQPDESTDGQFDFTSYQYENGRSYHGYRAGKYVFPNDERELERMDIEHHNQRLQMDNRLFLCPLKKHPKHILDLGTGTGIWAIDMADAYPECKVIGVDLSPTQPSMVPLNCVFQIDDFVQEWNYEDNRYDMIHHRFLTGHVSSFAQLYKRAFASLKPGGSLQAIEIEFGTFCDDGTLPEDSSLLYWGKIMQDAFKEMGNTIPKGQDYERWMREAGFENVHLRVIRRPMNDWPKDPKMKEIGRYCCLNFVEGLEGWTMAPLTRHLGWRPDEVKVLLAKVRKESVTRKIHAYQKGIVCYGTKPLTSRGAD